MGVRRMPENQMTHRETLVRDPAIHLRNSADTASVSPFRDARVSEALGSVTAVGKLTGGPGRSRKGSVVSDQVLNILKGLAGAGKSTWASTWRGLDEQHRTVVNRDSIRFELFGVYSDLTAEQEEVVSEIEFLRVDRALGACLSVTVDATHLEAAHRERWLELADRHRVRHVIIAIDTPLGECLRRNRARAAAGGRFVPEHFIKEMDAKARADEATSRPVETSITCDMPKVTLVCAGRDG